MDTSKKKIIYKISKFLKKINLKKIKMQNQNQVLCIRNERTLSSKNKNETKKQKEEKDRKLANGTFVIHQ